MSEEELLKQVKSVFEDYDDGLAAHGWAELRKKYPEKENKKLPIWWLAGIAASLLVVVGLYFYGAFDQEDLKLNIHNASKGTIKKDNSIAAGNNAATSKSAPNGDESINHGPSTAADKQSLAQHKNDNSTHVMPSAKSSDLTFKISKNADTAIKTSLQKPMLAAADVSNTAVPRTEVPQKTSIEHTVEAINQSVAVTATEPVKKSTEEFLKEQSKILANSSKKEENKHQAKTTLEVFTGTFFNYHDDNDAKLSAGLGLNANMKVAKNLVLSFGAGISQNKVSYENKVPLEVSQAMFSSKADAFNLAPSNASYSATATNDVSFNGRLLSIDLPMAIKFFPSKKQDFYIATGINSSTYLSQKYTYNYNLSNFGIQNGMAQPQQQTEESNLGGFDFANSAIIAIGFQQNLGKNSLIFEPYYKPAINTMGNKNLRISSAGINLKFNFNGNTKNK